MNVDNSLRDHVVALLDGGHAHATFEDAVKDLLPTLRGKRPDGLPYSAWELVEHIRISQYDILEFSRNASYVSPEWPKGYWPAAPVPAKAEDWDRSVAAVIADCAAMKKLVADPGTDLHARIPHGTGQTILREALLIADHNSYHTGQLVTVRRLLGAWH